MMQNDSCKFENQILTNVISVFLSYNLWIVFNQIFADSERNLKQRISIQLLHTKESEEKRIAVKPWHCEFFEYFLKIRF